MRRVLIVSISIVFVVSTSAQEATLTWAQQGTEEFRFRKIIPVGTSLIRLAVKKEGKRKDTEWIPVLTKFNGELKETVKLELPANGKKFYETLLKLRNNVYVIIAEETDDKDQFIYWAQRIDTATLQPSGHPVEIGRFYYPEMDLVYFEKRFITHSPD